MALCAALSALAAGRRWREAWKPISLASLGVYRLELFEGLGLRSGFGMTYLWLVGNGGMG